MNEHPQQSPPHNAPTGTWTDEESQLVIQQQQSPISSPPVEPSTPIYPTPQQQTNTESGPITEEPRSLTLASQLLLQDMAPRDPLSTLLPITLLCLVPLSIVLCIWLGGIKTGNLIIIAGLIATTIPTLARYKYKTRAALTLPISLNIALIAAIWQRHEVSSTTGAELTIVVVFLCSSLLFRAYYRTTASGRTLVGFGATAGALWLAYVINSQLDLSTLDLAWTSWLQPSLWVFFGLLLLLSLLAFMGPETSGASRHWSGGLLLWHALYTSAEIALLWKAPPSSLGQEQLGFSSSLSVCVIATVTIATIAGFHLLASTIGTRTHNSMQRS